MVAVAAGYSVRSKIETITESLVLLFAEPTGSQRTWGDPRARLIRANPSWVLKGTKGTIRPLRVVRPTRACRPAATLVSRKLKWRHTSCWAVVSGWLLQLPYGASGSSGRAVFKPVPPQSHQRRIIFSSRCIKNLLEARYSAGARAVFASGAHTVRHAVNFI
jgi:hypothetical protein